jgi:putative nucleotidyltransferase with HDIG domain
MDSNNNIIEKLFDTQEFASLPPVTMKVLELLQDEQSRDKLDMRNLSKLVETDASLTLKLIKIANSPLFALRDYVTSVQQAIIILGLNKVTNIVLGISIFSKFMYMATEGMQDILNQYWWHTSSTGSVSKSLAKRIGIDFKEKEFIGALLHDIGKLAMMQFDFNLFKEVINLVENEGKSDIEAEESVFGIAHTEVGSEIAKRWMLPKELSVTIKHLYNFSQAPADTHSLIAVINLSNMLCDIWGAGFYEGIKSIAFEETPEWKQILKSSKNHDLDFEEITFGLEKDYQNSADFLKIMSS